MCSKGIRCGLLSEVCVLARVYPADRCVHTFVFAHLSGFIHLGERKLNVSVCTRVCGYRLPALLLRVCVCVWIVLDHMLQSSATDGLIKCQKSSNYHQ